MDHMTPGRYLASWSVVETSGGQRRVVQWVADARQMEALREDPSVLDLRGVRVGSEQLPNLLVKLSRPRDGWLRGGHREPPWQRPGARYEPSYEEKLAVDILASLPPEQGGSLFPDNPAERRQAFAQRLALFALLTAGQADGSLLERARRTVEAYRLRAPRDVVVRSVS